MSTGLLFAKDTARFTAWQQFHRDNPAVFAKFLAIANEAAAAGISSIGARLIGEQIRWKEMIRTQSRDGFKVNDHHWPYYARLVVGLHPELDGLFEFRDSQFDTTVEQIVEFHKSVDPRRGALQSEAAGATFEPGVVRQSTIKVETSTSRVPVAGG